MKKHNISVNFATYRQWQRDLVKRRVKRNELSMAFLDGEMEKYTDEEEEAALLQGAHTLRTAKLMYEFGRGG